MNPATLCAVIVVAVAIWVWPAPRWSLGRVVEPGGSRSENQDTGSSDTDDPFATAAAFDLFAVCLRAGLPIGSAASVVARSAPAGLARPLASAAERLGLGADPEQAWRDLAEPVGHRRWRRVQIDGSERFEALATMARRSARSGSSLAGGLEELAATTRQQAHDDALAAAERAGVAISGPLGLCFLPAFVCLGIVPVVVGLAGGVLG